jgi:hypothetical protein
MKAKHNYVGKNGIIRRIFIVGCPRSGTTLMQSLLAGHPEVCSFPETHFFPNTVGSRWRRFLGIASPRAGESLLEFLEVINRQDMKDLVPVDSRLVRDYVDAFVAILDELALREGRSIWVEKTPRHLHFIGMIQKYVPDAAFLHVVRDGKDVVASLYEVTHLYPEFWGGPRSIEECVDRWNSDLKVTTRNAQKASHKVVRYEDLVRNPEAALERTCSFLGIDFTPLMIEQHSHAAEAIILDAHEWVQSAKQPVKMSDGSKFIRVFSRQEQVWIIGHLESRMGYEYRLSGTTESTL